MCAPREQSRVPASLRIPAEETECFPRGGFSGPRSRLGFASAMDVFERRPVATTAHPLARGARDLTQGVDGRGRRAWSFGRVFRVGGKGRGCEPHRMWNLTVRNTINLLYEFATRRSLAGEDLAQVALGQPELIREGALADAQGVDVIAKILHAAMFAHREPTGKCQCSQCAICAARENKGCCSL